MATLSACDKAIANNTDFSSLGRARLSNWLEALSSGKAITNESSTGFINFYNSVEALPFNSKEERTCFIRELSLMVSDVQLPLLSEDKDLYLLLDLHRYFAGSENALIDLSWKYIQAEIGGASFYCQLKKMNGLLDRIPQNLMSWRVLLELLMVVEEQEIVVGLMRGQGLDAFGEEQLLKIPDFYFGQILTLVKFQLRGKRFSKKLIRFAFDLIANCHVHPRYSSQFARLIEDFLWNIFPFFISKLSAHFSEDVLFLFGPKQASWFELYFSYRYPELNYERKESSVYDLSHLKAYHFAEIIRNIPVFIWWHLDSGYLRREMINHLAEGNNIRKLENTYGPCIGKRMAHIFHNLAPGECLVTNCVLYSFVKSLGGDLRLTEMLQRFIGFDFNTFQNMPHFELWKKIIMKLVDWNISDLLGDHEMLMLLSYLQHRIDEEPNFSIKGRTLNVLLDSAETWQEENRRLSRTRITSWKGDTYQEWNLFEDNRWYAIFQLNSSLKLEKESAEMHHCVRSYAYSCSLGNCSIWSLRQKNEANWESLATIEIVTKKIVQVKARFNQKPAIRYLNMIKEWANREGISYSID